MYPFFTRWSRTKEKVHTMMLGLTVNRIVKVLSQKSISAQIRLNAMKFSGHVGAVMEKL